MTRAELIAWVSDNYQVDPDYPFSKDYAETAVFRHQDTRKWFALCMEIQSDKLGLEKEESIDLLTLKADPFFIDSMVAKEGYHRAYHMNKKQWLSIELNGKVSEQEIQNLLDISFTLTDKKRRKGT